MRRTRWGYTYMGGIRIPPLPVNIILTDRNDGTRWLLSHSASGGPDGEGYISIDDTWNSKYKDLREYAANDEPVLGTNPTIRLFVRGGYLGYEIITLDRGIQDMDNARLLTRDGVRRETREIIVPSSWEVEGDELGWEVVEL